MSAMSVMTTMMKPLEESIRSHKSQGLDVKTKKGFWLLKVLRYSSFVVLAAGASSFGLGLHSLYALHPKNPHYRDDTCLACHATATADARGLRCLECHKKETMELKEGVTMGHSDCVSGVMAPTVEICTRCHKGGGFMQVIHQNGETIDVDIAFTHPLNIKVTEKTYPLKSLPLFGSQKKTINCATCHNPHYLNRNLKMLRMTSVELTTGKRDVSALCHNCHHSNGVL